MGESGLERDGIAALAPIVAEAVDAGDPAAIAIHDRAADELAAMADALRDALGFAAGALGMRPSLIRVKAFKPRMAIQ